MNRLIKATGNSPNTSSHFLPLLNLSGIFASKIDYCVRKIEKVSLEILQDQCPPGHYFSLQYASHAWSVRKVTQIQNQETPAYGLDIYKGITFCIDVTYIFIEGMIEVRS